MGIILTFPSEQALHRTVLHFLSESKVCVTVEDEDASTILDSSSLCLLHSAHSGPIQMEGLGFRV